MCGFVGFIGQSGANATHAETVGNMADAIRHRGPDDRGVWSDPDAGIALGHRRLSIVDLSPAGRQPMVSQSGRFVIAFNGEVYNHKDIRRDLETSGKAPTWRGHSDTEVMLATIETLGIAAALEKFVGMFAFALWDRQKRRLILARDRIGEKPLYWGVNNGVLLFGSDLAALKLHPLWQGEINRDALALMLRFNNIPAPFTIYKEIHKVQPGKILEFPRNSFVPQATDYWDASTILSASVDQPFCGSPQDAIAETERLLSQSLAGQMIADVPLGAFLSGGIDSSLVVALMQAANTRPVRTFSIGFEEAAFNEAPYAKAVANHLGTDHTEFYVSTADALATVPRIAKVYSEPFADSSQIPTMLVSELARRHVTVALSGDGGDELFSGYNRYAIADRTWKWLRHIPLSVRRVIAYRIATTSPQSWDRFTGMTYLPSKLKVQRLGDKLIKAASVAGQASLDDVYQTLISHWQSPNEIVIGGHDDVYSTSAKRTDVNLVRHMMQQDLTRYLPDDILVKVDRASMAVGLEARVPMLDHRLVEFSGTLPMGILRRDGKTKWPLRQVLDRYVPGHLINRPKMGFGVPIDSWLRGPLKDWAEALLDESRLKREGFFHPAPIRQAWEDHLSGNRNVQYPIWVILMFGSWLENELGGTS